MSSSRKGASFVRCKFSPDYPRNAAVQWIKIVLHKTAKSCKISEIFLHIQNSGLGSMLPLFLSSPPLLSQVLKAFGHSYHPKCFCCDVCGMCLDGIPYTSDSTEKVYGTPDFHRYDVRMMSSKISTNWDTLYLHQCIQVQVVLSRWTKPDSSPTLL